MIRVIAAAASFSLASVSLAGPLNPPAGPVSSTNKTLQQVEPRTPLHDTTATIVIDTPGSYYLAEHVTSRGVGIRIEAPGVTLDLNGFSVIGNLSGSSSHHAIQLSPVEDGRPVTIRNGYLQNFSGRGVSSSATLIHVVLEDVHVSGCVSNGVLVNGDLTAARCTVLDCGSTGFFVFGEGTLVDCAARENFRNGFEVEAGTLRNCIASNNLEIGFDLGFNDVNGGSIRVADCVAHDNGTRGFYLSNNSVATGCVADGNDLGFQALSEAVIENCSARLNDQWGFLTGSSAAVTNCVASENGLDGFSIGSGSAISNCTAEANGASGFETGVGCGVSNCSARFNTGIGIEVGAGTTITNCSAVSSRVDGFVLEPDVRMFHCIADGNGTAVANGAGIRATSGCLVDSCLVTDNDIGIVSGTGSLIIRNGASGNLTNYDLAGSDHGTIIAPSGQFSSTNTFANIEF